MKWKALAGAGLVVILLGAYVWWNEDPAPDQVARSVSTAIPGARANGLSASAPAVERGPASRAELLRQRQERYDRAAHTYNSYRDATRYPPSSRPLAEHTDQEHPFDPIVSERVLQDGRGKVVKNLHLRTSQDRVFVNGEESVNFSLQAMDDQGNALPLNIRRSVAIGLPDAASNAGLVQADVPFAGGGVYTARLTPSAQGFANYSGTIRLTVQVSAGGETGEVNFDVVYSPQVPAKWLGIREALEKGSLNFYVKAQVMVPGRYVISARVYDAKGKAFALLQYNDEVSAGAKEFKLTLFGALVQDLRPSFPVRLVDMEGFLLKPDTFPDRAMLPRRPGTVYTSGSYGIDQFSLDEWSSEERTRYLNEYQQDLRNARSALDAP